MKKKLLALALTLAMLLSLAACTKTSKDPNTATNNDEPTELTDPNTPPDNPNAQWLFENGIPQNKTTHAHVNMVLNSVITLENEAARQEYGDIDMNIELDADLVTQPGNDKSYMDGMSRIQSYGMDMEYPILTYTDGATSWSQDADTQLWAVNIDPDYIHEETKSLFGLTAADFDTLTVNETNDTYGFIGNFNLSEENAMTESITNLTGQARPSAEVNFTAEFDKETCYLKNLKIELSESTTSDDGLFAISKFEYAVVVNAVDDEEIIFPEGLPDPNDVAGQTNPGIQPRDMETDTENQETLEPEVDEDGNLTFIIESDLSEDTDTTQP